jgi:hypothetical protein
VVFWQDGLRLYLAGHPNAPVPDVEDDVDAEDAGQKGINYRSALLRSRTMLRDDQPPTPVWKSPPGEEVWIRLIGACDKPRNHTFTVHGVNRAVAPWQPNSPHEGALSGLTADTRTTSRSSPSIPATTRFAVACSAGHWNRGCGAS